MDGATLATLLLSGLLGFLINIAVFLQIKHTRYPSSQVLGLGFCWPHSFLSSNNNTQPAHKQRERHLQGLHPAHHLRRNLWYNHPLLRQGLGHCTHLHALHATAHASGDKVTPMNVMGTLLVVAGSAWYSHVRFTEMAQIEHQTERKKWM
jgi:hypothetical protein